MQNENLSKKSRREFLQTSAMMSGMLPFMASPMLSSGLQAIPSLNEMKPPKPLKILLLGGTSYLGPHQIAFALSRGHSITTFTRGKTKPTIHKEAFKEVESLVGDRNDNLEALKGRKWDVVIDNSGRQVKWTEDTAQLLKDNADLYLYTSSISVFYPYTGTDFTEERKLVLKMPDEKMSEDDKFTYKYGIMKANSELAAINAFGKDRTIVIRPHFIVGPGDKTDRFVYWPARLEKGGEVLLPGKSNDQVQFIDVRDLSHWMIRLLENRTAGTFNATGPGFRMNMPAFAYGAHAAFYSPIDFVHVDDYDFLLKNGVPFMCPWVLPMDQFEGMSKALNTKAIQNGLTFTPLSKTITDTIEWWHSDAVTEERRTNMLTGEQSFMTKEKEVLALWKNYKK